MATQLHPYVPRCQCFSATHRGKRTRHVYVPVSKHANAAAADMNSFSSEQPLVYGPDQHTLCSRRQWLAAGAAALIASISSFLQPLPTVAAATGCELQTSSSGLKWCDIAVGNGSQPIKSAFTKVQYIAKLASTGAVFDSTYDRKTPLIFKVGEHELIEALDVAMLGTEDMPPMLEGGKRLVVAPPGPMQRQGTKSLLWVVGLSQALDDAGELSPEGTPTSDLVFEIEFVPKRRG